MNTKLIFLDIDGTLTVLGYNTPPASALDALRRARANGHKVFLCTGRDLAMLRPLLEYGFDGYIASAGGYVVCGDEVICDLPMDREVFRLAMECLSRNRVFRTVECRDGTYGDMLPGGLPDEEGSFSNSDLLRFRAQLSETLDIRPIEEYDGAPVYKIVLMCVDRRQLDEPIALLGGELEFCLQDIRTVRCINAEASAKGHDKGTGIRLLCRHLGKEIADTIGFGDSMNDKEMFETVGFSVCMGNGQEAVKAIADYVCPDVSDDGLYRAFEELGLI